MQRSLLLAAALAATLASTVFAQPAQQPTGYHSVSCIKVRDGKMPEYQQFFEESRKVGQAIADSGRMTAGYRFRSVMPAGQAAACDYVIVSVYAGAPPAPSASDALASMLQKAGISMTADEYRAKQRELTRLVSTEMWRSVGMVGDIRKGDYVIVNHMKVADMANWLELERSIWKPMAETWVKNGTIHGWGVSVPVMPAGTDMKYQAVTLDIMPSWDQAFKGVPLQETFKQVHADKDLDQVMQKIEKSRQIGLRELVVAEDVITPSGKSAPGGGR